MVAKYSKKNNRSRSRCLGSAADRPAASTECDDIRAAQTAEQRRPASTAAAAKATERNQPGIRAVNTKSGKCNLKGTKNPKDSDFYEKTQRFCKNSLGKDNMVTNAANVASFKSQKSRNEHLRFVISDIIAKLEEKRALREQQPTPANNGGGDGGGGGGDNGGGGGDNEGDDVNNDDSDGDDGSGGSHVNNDGEGDDSDGNGDGDGNGGGDGGGGDNGGGDVNNDDNGDDNGDGNGDGNGDDGGATGPAGDQPPLPAQPPPAVNITVENNVVTIKHYPDYYKDPVPVDPVEVDYDLVDGHFDTANILKTSIMRGRQCVSDMMLDKFMLGGGSDEDIRCMFINLITDMWIGHSQYSDALNIPIPFKKEDTIFVVSLKTVALTANTYYKKFKPGKDFDCSKIPKKCLKLNINLQKMDKCDQYSRLYPTKKDAKILKRMCEEVAECAYLPSTVISHEKCVRAQENLSEEKRKVKIEPLQLIRIAQAEIIRKEVLFQALTNSTKIWKNKKATVVTVQDVRDIVYNIVYYVSDKLNFTIWNDVAQYKKLLNLWIKLFLPMTQVEEKLVQEITFDNEQDPEESNKPNKIMTGVLAGIFLLNIATQMYGKMYMTSSNSNTKPVEEEKNEATGNNDQMLDIYRLMSFLKSLKPDPAMRLLTESYSTLLNTSPKDIQKVFQTFSSLNVYNFRPFQPYQPQAPAEPETKTAEPETETAEPKTPAGSVAPLQPFQPYQPQAPAEPETKTAEPKTPAGSVAPLQPSSPSSPLPLLSTSLATSPPPSSQSVAAFGDNVFEGNEEMKKWYESILEDVDKVSLHEQSQKINKYPYLLPAQEGTAQSQAGPVTTYATYFEMMGIVPPEYTKLLSCTEQMKTCPATTARALAQKLQIANKVANSKLSNPVSKVSASRVMKNTSTDIGNIAQLNPCQNNTTEFNLAQSHLLNMSTFIASNMCAIEALSVNNINSLDPKDVIPACLKANLLMSDACALKNLVLASKQLPKGTYVTTSEYDSSQRPIQNSLDINNLAIGSKMQHVSALDNTTLRKCSIVPISIPISNSAFVIVGQSLLASLLNVVRLKYVQHITVVCNMCSEIVNLHQLANLKGSGDPIATPQIIYTVDRFSYTISSFKTLLNTDIPVLEHAYQWALKSLELQSQNNDGDATVVYSIRNVLFSIMFGSQCREAFLQQLSKNLLKLSTDAINNPEITNIGPKEIANINLQISTLQKTFKQNKQKITNNINNITNVTDNIDLDVASMNPYALELIKSESKTQTVLNVAKVTQESVRNITKLLYCGHASDNLRQDGLRHTTGVLRQNFKTYLVNVMNSVTDLFNQQNTPLLLFIQLARAYGFLKDTPTTVALNAISNNKSPLSNVKDLIKRTSVPSGTQVLLGQQPTHEKQNCQVIIPRNLAKRLQESDVHVYVEGNPVDTPNTPRSNGSKRIDIRNKICLPDEKEKQKCWVDLQDLLKSNQTAAAAIALSLVDKASNDRTELPSEPSGTAGPTSLIDDVYNIALADVMSFVQDASNAVQVRTKAISEALTNAMSLFEKASSGVKVTLAKAMLLFQKTSNAVEVTLATAVSFVQKASYAVTVTKEGISEALANVIWLVQEASNAVQVTTEGISNTLATVISLAKKASNAVQVTTEGISNALATVMSLAKKASNAFQDMTKGMSKALDDVMSLAQNALNAVQVTTEGISKGISEALATAMSFGQKALKAVRVTTKTISKALATAMSLFENASNGVQETLAAAMSFVQKASNAVQVTREGISKALANVMPLLEKASNAVQVTTEGISGKLANVMSLVQNASSAVQVKTEGRSEPAGTAGPTPLINLDHIHNRTPATTAINTQIPENNPLIMNATDVLEAPIRADAEAPIRADTELNSIQTNDILTEVFQNMSKAFNTATNNSEKLRHTVQNLCEAKILVDNMTNPPPMSNEKALTQFAIHAKQCKQKIDEIASNVTTSHSSGEENELLAGAILSGSLPLANCAREVDQKQSNNFRRWGEALTSWIKTGTNLEANVQNSTLSTKIARAKSLVVTTQNQIYDVFMDMNWAIDLATGGANIELLYTLDNLYYLKGNNNLFKYVTKSIATSEFLRQINFNFNNLRLPDTDSFENARRQDVNDAVGNDFSKRSPVNANYTKGTNSTNSTNNVSSLMTVAGGNVNFSSTSEALSYARNVQMCNKLKFNTNASTVDIIPTSTGGNRQVSGPLQENQIIYGYFKTTKGNFVYVQFIANAYNTTVTVVNTENFSLDEQNRIREKGKILASYSINASNDTDIEKYPENNAVELANLITLRTDLLNKIRVIKTSLKSKTRLKLPEFLQGDLSMAALIQAQVKITVYNGELYVNVGVDEINLPLPKLEIVILYMKDSQRKQAIIALQNEIQKIEQIYAFTKSNPKVPGKTTVEKLRYRAPQCTFEEHKKQSQLNFIANKTQNIPLSVLLKCAANANNTGENPSTLENAKYLMGQGIKAGPAAVAVTSLYNQSDLEEQGLSPKDALEAINDGTAIQSLLNNTSLTASQVEDFVKEKQNQSLKKVEDAFQCEPRFKWGKEALTEVEETCRNPNSSLLIIPDMNASGPNNNASGPNNNAIVPNNNGSVTDTTKSEEKTQTKSEEKTRVDTEIYDSLQMSVDLNTTSTLDPNVVPAIAVMTSGALASVMLRTYAVEAAIGFLKLGLPLAMSPRCNIRAFSTGKPIYECVGYAPFRILAMTVGGTLPANTALGTTGAVGAIANIASQIEVGGTTFGVASASAATVTSLTSVLTRYFYHQESESIPFEIYIDSLKKHIEDLKEEIKHIQSEKEDKVKTSRESFDYKHYNEFIVNARGRVKALEIELAESDLKSNENDKFSTLSYYKEYVMKATIYNLSARSLPNNDPERTKFLNSAKHFNKIAESVGNFILNSHQKLEDYVVGKINESALQKIKKYGQFLAEQKYKEEVILKQLRPLIRARAVNSIEKENTEKEIREKYFAHQQFIFKELKLNRTYAEVKSKLGLKVKSHSNIERILKYKLEKECLKKGMSKDFLKLITQAISESISPGQQLSSADNKVITETITQIQLELGTSMTYLNILRAAEKSGTSDLSSFTNVLETYVKHQKKVTDYVEPKIQDESPTQEEVEDAIKYAKKIRQDAQKDLDARVSLYNRFINRYNYLNSITRVGDQETEFSKLEQFFVEKVFSHRNSIIWNHWMTEDISPLDWEKSSESFTFLKVEVQRDWIARANEFLKSDEGKDEFNERDCANLEVDLSYNPDFDIGLLGKFEQYIGKFWQ